MNTRDNGGPAFPCSHQNMMTGFPTDEMSGMTLRDYFIAHAPAEPQPWFRPDMPPRPSRFPIVSEDGLRKYESVHEAEKTEGDCWESVNQRAIDAWEADYQKQQYIQWPSA